MKRVKASGYRGHSEGWMPEFANQWTRRHYDGVYRNERTGEVIRVTACEAERGYLGTERAPVWTDDPWTLVETEEVTAP